MNDLKVAVQLYTVRNDMEADMDATLKNISDMGYDYVEFAGYFGHTAEEIRFMLDKNNLECISVHQGYGVFLENSQESINYLKILGTKYCAVPWMGIDKQKGTEAFDKTVKDLIKVGTLLKENGIQLLYHNHDFEFEIFEDKFLLDWLYESIPEELLQTEIDTCWVHYAGYNPSEYIKKYAKRSPVVHLKDFVCKKLADGPVYELIDNSSKGSKMGSREDNGFELRPLGQGIQDFSSILKAVKEADTQYIVVEQDSSVDLPPMECIKQSREFLKSLGL